MTFFEAYAQAKTLGRKLINPHGEQFTVAFLDTTDIPVTMAMSNSWEVAEPEAVEVTEELLAQKWNEAIVSGGFRAVSRANDSALFRELKKQLFG